MANSNYSPASTREGAFFCIGGMPTKGAQTSYERFSDTELLGRLVGVKQAKSIYKGSLASVFASADDKALTARELVKRWLCEEMKAGDALNSPGAVREYLKLHFNGREYESFVVIFLDAQHRVIDVEELFRGTLTQTSVYPREVVKAGLKHNAAAVIFASQPPKRSNRTEPIRPYVNRCIKASLGTG